MKLLVMGDDLAQVRALKRQLVSLPKSVSHTKELVDTWARGDAERFAAMIEQDFAGHVEAQDLLISNRNRAWVPSVAELLQSGKTAMVTVGAAHIGGPKGLISLLCAAGSRGRTRRVERRRRHQGLRSQQLSGDRLYRPFPQPLKSQPPA